MITDGAVGIPYPKVAHFARGGRVTKPKPAKGDYRRSKKDSARSLKRIGEALYKIARASLVFATVAEKLMKLGKDLYNLYN